jgi:acyl-CoA synthetase
VTLEAVQAHLATAGLAKQKWPEEVRVVEAFDRTPSGKIRKRTLRDALRAEAS